MAGGLGGNYSTGSAVQTFGAAPINGGTGGGVFPMDQLVIAVPVKICGADQMGISGVNTDLAFAELFDGKIGVAVPLEAVILDLFNRRTQR